MAKTTAKLAALYEAVYANPDDDAPRAVLADALQEAGDPRGEFIALQLARGRGGKKTRREMVLGKAGRRTWLGPLAMAVPNKGLVFERGFVSACELQHHRENIEPYLHHREWATVEQVTPGRWDGSLQPLADALPGLRTLIFDGHAGQLPSHERLERIRVKFVYDDKHPEHLATLKLPALRELSVGWCYATFPKLERFLDSVAPSLRVLELDPEDPDAWIPWLARHRLDHAQLAIVGTPWYLHFKGDRIIAAYHDGGEPRDDAQAARELAQRLDLVPSPNRWHVTFDRALPIRGKLATTLKRFASHALQPEAE